MTFAVVCCRVPITQRGYNDVAMNIQPHVLSRLIAARHLIDSSGQELTSFSDPLAVAQKILIAHDVAELVLCALKAQLSLKPVEANGKVLVEPTFMATAIAICEKTYPNEYGDVGSAIDKFDQMNRLRVAFKHHGNLPEVSSTFNLYSDVVDLLNGICSHLIGIALVEINHSAAIKDELARNRLVHAEQLIHVGDYKKALETISLALSQAFSSLNLPTYMNPGKASSEDALLLSGRGVDPASFLTMQKLLPFAHIYVDNDEVKWELRKTGHKGNWTKEDTEFCLRTAISTIVRLQSAQEMPIPQGFYDWFDDVVEILSEAPEVFKIDGFPGLHGEPELITSFRKGDRITGRVKGYWMLDANAHCGDETEFDIEDTPLIALFWAKHPALKEEEQHLFRTDAYWFKRSEIAISYQSNGWRGSLHEPSEQDC
jgi:hypothetical protein